MNNQPVNESEVDASRENKETRNKTSRTPAAGRAGPDNRFVRRRKMNTPRRAVMRRISRAAPMTASSSLVYEKPAETPDGADPVGAMNCRGKKRRSRLSDA